jgi:SAM-dependent methyltransferase
MGRRSLNIGDYNRYAWDRQVDHKNKFTLPVDSQIISAARNGIFSVLLTETRPVPQNWFPPFHNLEVLGLACGGGQQGPVFAALGANVTIFDNSPSQLEQDRLVAEREGLRIRTVQGDMRNLSVFSDETFDMIFHPVSNVFCPDVLPVWREAFRVLRHGGVLLSGQANPVYYLFGTHADEQKDLVVKYGIPYSDINDMEPEELDLCIEEGIPLEFGHSLTDLIGGQIEAGFSITGFYEDICPDSPLRKYHPEYIATRAFKL